MQFFRDYPEHRAMFPPLWYVAEEVVQAQIQDTIKRTGIHFFSFIIHSLLFTFSFIFMVVRLLVTLTVKYFRQRSKRGGRWNGLC